MRKLLKAPISILVIFLMATLAISDSPIESANANVLKKIQKSVKKSGSKVRKTLKRTNQKVKKAVKNVAKSPAAPIIGGIVAGVVARKAFDNKFIGVAVGVGVGAFIASNLKKDLNEDQQTKMTRSTTSAVASGENSSWKDDNGTSGEVRVISTEETSEAVSIPVYKEKVSDVPPLDFIGETYEITANSNVRGGPDTNYEKVGYVKKGTMINVVGKVKDKDWYFISENGVGTGFVFGELLKPSASSLIGDTPQLEDDETVFIQQISETKVCRTVEQTITLADGTIKTEEVKACKGANGWEMVKPESPADI